MSEKPTLDNLFQGYRAKARRATARAEMIVLSPRQMTMFLDKLVERFPSLEQIPSLPQSKLDAIIEEMHQTANLVLKLHDREYAMSMDFVRQIQSVDGEQAIEYIREIFAINRPKALELMLSVRNIEVTLS